MRDRARITEVLGLLDAIWHKHPDMRLGQLILNAVSEDELYYAEEDKLMRKLRATYEYPDNTIGQGSAR